MFFQVTDNYNIYKPEINCIYLIEDRWDDWFEYETLFYAVYYDEQGMKYDLGNVKIAKKNIGEYERDHNGKFKTRISLLEKFEAMKFEMLPDDYFSLGQSIEYYKKINEIFGECANNFYFALKDIAFDFSMFEELYKQKEDALLVSLMREIHYPTVEQFNRIINDEAELTEYNISFFYGDEKIQIDVEPDSLPPSNVHVIIGRNGVGKTWLLYHMVRSLLEKKKVDLSNCKSDKYDREGVESNTKIIQTTTEDYEFAQVVGISYSVFDDGFSGISYVKKSDDIEENNKENYFRKCYKYIGLVDKNQKNGKNKTKSLEDLSKEFEDVIKEIRKDVYKRKLYNEVCEELNVDPMFRDNGFIDLLQKSYNKEEESKYIDKIIKQFKKLSSGHMIIMLSLTLLCESIYEKTIVFIDEPETHLYPPLLSTYIRTLSFLLRKRNAVAIIATHSPIVVQEVPQSCVTIVNRVKLDMTFFRPEMETFAENTDSITRGIFGYEVIKTGFYKLISEESKGSYENVFEKIFKKKVGFLGQIMIQKVIREKKEDNNEKDSSS